MNNFNYDLIVIGAGSGGTRTARIAAGYGAKTAVIEGDRPVSYTHLTLPTKA